MSRLKTLATLRTARTFILFAGFIGSSVVSADAAGFPISPSERACAFSECAGRYSAVAEHERLFNGVASEAAEHRRDLFVTLLDAVLPDAIDYGMPQEQTMSWRIEAKAGHARLLSAAVFGMRKTEAANAREAATDFIGNCDKYILGS